MSSHLNRDGPWQDCLAKVCEQLGYALPTFNIMSDRRGGRTAWTATVLVNNYPFAARFSYDGKNLHNAKEDACEVAYRHFYPDERKQ